MGGNHLDQRDTYQHSILHTIALRLLTFNRCAIASLVLEVHIQVQRNNRNCLHRVSSKHSKIN